MSTYLQNLVHRATSSPTRSQARAGNGAGGDAAVFDPFEIWSRHDLAPDDALRHDSESQPSKVGDPALDEPRGVGSALGRKPGSALPTPISPDSSQPPRARENLPRVDGHDESEPDRRRNVPRRSQSRVPDGLPGRGEAPPRRPLPQRGESDSVQPAARAISSDATPSRSIDAQFGDRTAMPLNRTVDLQPRSPRDSNPRVGPESVAESGQGKPRARRDSRFAFTGSDVAAEGSLQRDSILSAQLGRTSSNTLTPPTGSDGLGPRRDFDAPARGHRERPKVVIGQITVDLTSNTRPPAPPQRARRVSRPGPSSAPRPRAATSNLRFGLGQL